ncbi:MAG: leucyl aminopeptidase family protein, partial [Planctomycetota bacterium]|nr:leucyl aminopeptidase family protein [Planctomycetota bacterium]
MFTSIRVAPKGASSTLAVGYFQGQSPDKATLALDPAIAAAAKRTEATGDLGSIVEAFPTNAKSPYTRVLLVGLGKADAFKPGSMRSVSAAIGRKLAAVKADSLTADFSAALNSAKADPAASGQAFGEGLGILGWVCDEFKGSSTPDPKRTKLVVRSGDSTFLDALDRGLKLAESTNFCRTLSQTPPNVATPAYMAQVARRLARETGLKVTVMEGDTLEREKLTGHINVGKASENKPCMIRLEYTPKGGAKGRFAKPAVLIGKTMTYDTGGLSLKINNGMVGMKRDKDGGCAVLGAMHAIATLIKPRRPVVAFLAAAENSISDEAYRPDDVLTYRNGVTVEITNTDAEGRLVLADALAYACDKESPAYIVDLATLTGGVVVALGSTYCGMFCEDDKLRARVEAAAEASGERVWRLPMHQEYRDMMKSPIADILNSNPNRKAHPIQGAAFL